MNHLESPTRLKVENSFFPQVQFLVYQLELPDVFNKHYLNLGGNGLHKELRDSNDVKVPATGAVFELKYIFQQGSSPHVCYILDSDIYPPSMEGYKAFLQKLKFAASQCGEKYTTSNIRRDTKTMNVMKVALCCCHAKTEDKRTKNKRLLNSNEALQSRFKEDTINNSRKNTSREQGYKVLPRRRHSMYHSTKCALKTINIHFGKHCLFLVPQDNDQKHTNHIELQGNELPTHLNDDKLHELKIMSHSNASGYCLQKGLLELHSGNVNASKKKMANFARKHRHKANSESLDLKYGLNDSRSCVEILKDFNCRVISLTDITHYMPHASKKLKKSSGTFCAEDPQESCDVSDVLPGDSVECSILDSVSAADRFLNVCIESNSSEHISQEQIQQWVQSTKPGSTTKHTVCISWSNREQYLLARAFCHSLHIDATHKICTIDNLLMLTLTVRDTNGDTFFVARFWIPNQAKWMFRYILLEALPQLFGRMFCSKVKSFVSDGDEQLIKMIDLSIAKFYTNARRIPCSWHLSNRQIRSNESCWHLKRLVSPYVKEWFCRFLESWLCSFMVPGRGVEEHDEYIVSKCLLLGAINSDVVKSCFTDDAVLALNDFLNCKIFPYEESYVAFNNSKLFNMEQHSNSGHEGTNNAVKHMSDPVTERDSLALATKKVSAYDRARFNERTLNVTSQFIGITQHTNTFRHLTRKMVGVVEAKGETII